MGRLEQLAAELKAWRDDCIDARQWSGPTVYPRPLFDGGYHAKEARALQVAADLRTVLAALSQPETLGGGPNYPVVPEGWRMVPVEPTREMTQHGCSALKTSFDLGGDNWHQSMAKAYAAMLSASLPPPLPEREEIARVIDPEAFICGDDEPRIVRERCMERQAAALEKADAVLAIPLPIERGAFPKPGGCE